MNEQDAVDKILELLLHIEDTSLLKGLIHEIRALIGQDSPMVVCLCGSTRFSEAYQKANFDQTLAGRIVLTIGCDMRSDAELFSNFTPWQYEDTKERLDELHLRKIDMADEILVLNVNGYIGDSTRREIEYARANGKHIRWLELPEKLL